MIQQQGPSVTDVKDSINRKVDVLDQKNIEPNDGTAANISDAKISGFNLRVTFEL